MLRAYQLKANELSWIKGATMPTINEKIARCVPKRFFFFIINKETMEKIIVIKERVFSYLLCRR